jgi:hypothetical protein
MALLDDIHKLAKYGEQPQLTEHKSYYDHPTIKGLQAIDVIQDFSYNVATAMAYLWRAGRKPGNDAIEDLEKARMHIYFEINRLKRQKPLTKTFSDLRAEFGDGWRDDNAD